MKIEVIKLPRDLKVKDLLNKIDRSTTENADSVDIENNIEREKFFCLFDQMTEFIDKERVTPSQLSYQLDEQQNSFKDRIMNCVYRNFSDTRRIQDYIRKWRKSDNRMILEIIITLQLKLKEIKQEQINFRLKEHNITLFKQADRERIISV